MGNDLVEMPTIGSTKDTLSSSPNLCSVIQSDVTITDGFLSTTATSITPSRDPNLVLSSNDNLKDRHSANRLLATDKNYPSDRYSFEETSDSIVVNDQPDRLSNNRLTLIQQPISGIENQVSTYAVYYISILQQN